MTEAYFPPPSPPILPKAYGSLPEGLIPGLLRLLADTSDTLTRHYEQSQPLKVDRKADQSPVTDADQNAHEQLATGLASLTPHIPLVSEESAPEDISNRRAWRMCWMVDPLDGTREFIDRTGEFTVNVALIVDHVPVLGAIAVPMMGLCYLGIPGQGLWQCRGDGFGQLSILTPEWDSQGVIRLLASQRHSAKRVATLVARLANSGRPVERVNAGSALKFCVLVDGRGDIYPRSSPCYEWDVAAGDALVRAIGGVILTEEDVPMAYNMRPGLLVDYFVAAAPSGMALLPLLSGVHNLFTPARAGDEAIGEKSVNG